MLILKKFEHDSSCSNIAILDNCSITFLQALQRRSIETKQLFQEYDCIIIPVWVSNEFLGNPETESYIQYLLDSDIAVKYVEETEFSDLIPSDSNEQIIFDLFLVCTNLYTCIKSYLHKNVKTEDILDLEDSHVWIQTLYDNWPLTNGSGKKNAGEISINVLAAILSIYYNNYKTITVFTQDRDTYEVRKKTLALLAAKNIVHESDCPIIFKTNDSIVKQLLILGEIDKPTIKSIRDEDRSVIFDIIKEDGSVNPQERKISNDEFCDLLDIPDSFSIIF